MMSVSVAFVFHAFQTTSSLIHEKFLKACRAGKLCDIEQLFRCHSIDLDAVGNDHKTPLFHAITARCLSAVRFLVKHGANVCKKSFVFFRLDCSAINFESCDEPPLVTAARAGSTEILLCLLQNGCSPNQLSDSPANHAALASKVSTGSALHFACDATNIDMVRLLLTYNADVNATDRRLECPLHLVVRCKGAVCSIQCEILDLLCKNGAKVEAMNKKECSPLYLASLYGCTSKVETLLRYGASVSSCSDRDGGYGSALHIAAFKDRAELASLLVNNGAQINQVNANGFTPLQLNINTHSKSDIASFLIYHGSIMNGLDKNNLSLLASCINNLRLDCESLAVLMVEAGYDLNQDLWLVPQELRIIFKPSSEVTTCVSSISIPEGRVRRLCEWLHRRQRNPEELSKLCRMVIRRQLSEALDGRSIVIGISQLPLPPALRDFVFLKSCFDCCGEQVVLNSLNHPN